jgi:hypothetical protein
LPNLASPEYPPTLHEQRHTARLHVRITLDGGRRFISTQQAIDPTLPVSCAPAQELGAELEEFEDTRTAFERP